MKLNFDDEQEGENSENHMKIPNSDQVFKQQVKFEQIQNLRSSVKFNNILSILIIIFCSLFTAYQLLQDHRLTKFQNDIFDLKEQIKEIQLNMNSNNQQIIKSDIKKENEIHQLNSIEDSMEKETKNKPLINFSAETILLKGKFENEIKYLQDCMTDTRIKKYEKIETPKISIIVPIYKQDNYIYRFIQSIQKQKLTELEIIFIEDYSLSNKPTKLEEISKIDKRIIILKNNENTTLLNAYIKGISSVKSEFILFLEEDSILLPNLNNIYEKTKLDNKNINEYSFIKGTSSGITFDENKGNIEKSKEQILDSFYDFNYINENPLMNKIIKADVLKNVIKNFKEYYLVKNYELHVDSLIYISLCTYAESYKSFGDLYISFNMKKETSKEDIFLEKMFNSTIILANFIYELKHQNTDMYNKRCLLIYNLFNWPLNYNRKLYIDQIESKNIINKYMNNKLIIEENMRKLKMLIRRIIDRMRNKI